MVAPLDAQIYSAESFAFAQSAQNAVTAVLGRTLPQGGGDTFYNLSSDGSSATRGWMQGVGWRIDPAGFVASSAGMEGGLDRDIAGGLRLGIAAGYQSDNLSDGAGGSATQEQTFVALYGSQTIGPVGLSAAFAYAYSNDATNRAAGFGASHANHALDAVLGAVQASAPFHAGDFIVTPAAGVYISDVTGSAFQELNARNSAFAISGANSSGTAVSPFVQVGVSRNFTTASGIIITPDLMGGFQYDNVASGLSLNLFAQDGTLFSGNQIDLGRSSALFRGAVTAHKGRWTGFVSYDGEVGGNWNDQTLSGGFRFAF